MDTPSSTTTGTADWNGAIRRLHDALSRVVLAVTGGGSAAIGDLLRVPGASATVLEAIVPYAAAAMTDLLGREPEDFCSQRTARAMAMTAFLRGRYLRMQEGAEETDSGEDHVIGVGCTASLVSDRPKRGPHRAHVAVQSTARTVAAHLELTKGARDRAGEEQVVAKLILSELLRAAGIEGIPELPLRDDESVSRRTADADEDLQDLLLGRIDAVCTGGPPPEEEQHSSRVIFPGAFNPRHKGHRRMAEVAAERLGRPVEWEISIENVDKPPLDYIEIEERAAGFGEDDPLWLTRAATFVDKSQIFPGATFIVGADTVLRIADPKYYGHDMTDRDAAIAEIGENGCRFLVFGRLVRDEFRTQTDLDLPRPLVELCDEVGEEEFRADVSSTELRRRERES